MKYKLILFDADGTLFDFEKAEKNAFDKTMQQFEVQEDLDDLHKIYETINRAIWQEFQEKKINSVELRLERFRRFFNNVKLDLSPQEVSPVYLKNLGQGIDLLPGAEDTIRHFHGKCEIALATNGLTEVQRPRFAGSGLASYFKNIFISEEIGFPKPYREFFEHIFRQLPYLDDAVIVGDNFSSDIVGGNDFGIDTCWFNPNKEIKESGIIPTFEISDLSELKQLFED